MLLPSQQHHPPHCHLPGLGPFAFVYKLWGRDKADCSCWWVARRKGCSCTFGPFSVINQKQFRQQSSVLARPGACLLDVYLSVSVYAVPVAVCGTCKLGKFMHGFTFLRVIICNVNYACWVEVFVVELLQTISQPRAKWSRDCSCIVRVSLNLSQCQLPKLQVSPCSLQAASTLKYVQELCWYILCIYLLLTVCISKC